MSLFNKDRLTKLKSKASEVLNKAIDQHVTLAVTGLSRSGKTAFITSLVNQLINEGNGNALSFFDVVHQGRFIAAKRVPQKHLHIPRFDYEGAFKAFTNQPPHWPQPTQGISEIKIAIRYQPHDSFLKYASDFSTLYLNITDYPGEWLLDLPMLNQSFEQWSEQMTTLLQTEPRKQYAQDFFTQIKKYDPLAPITEESLAELAKIYTNMLMTYRHELGLSVIQPGRFILPGELADAPILQFVPFPFFNDIENDEYIHADNNSFIGMLRARFTEYKERVVRKFYQEHFVHFDRQIVLADCLTPLNNGVDSFTDLQQAINLIIESFNYGKSGILSRLFSPKIDKLIFAATKADHVTPEQHPNLVSLLEQLVHSAKNKLEFDRVQMSTMAIASVKATTVGAGNYQNKTIPVIHGIQAKDKSSITLFPGAVPDKLPNSNYWQEHPFSFIEFLPQHSVADNEMLPHLRMDQVLQYLIGDKMR